MKISGLAVAGFVFAIVALLTSEAVSILMMFAGLFLSLAGFVSIESGKTSGRGFSIATFIMLGINFIWLIGSELS